MLYRVIQILQDILPGERHIDIIHDVTIHEEAAFKRSKELLYNTDAEENVTPTSKDPDTDSPHIDVHRENPT